MAQDGPEWSTLLAMGVTNALCLIVGMSLGWLIDQLVGTFPLFALLGLALGIAGACVFTVTEGRKFLR